MGVLLNILCAWAGSLYGVFSVAARLTYRFLHYLVLDNTRLSYLLISGLLQIPPFRNCSFFQDVHVLYLVYKLW